MEKITKKTNIASLISEHPEAADVLMAFGLHCVGCFASHFDTIEEGAKVHEMLEEEIDEMIEELNVVLNNKDQDGEVDDVKEEYEKEDKDEDEDEESDGYVSSSNSDLKVKVDENCIGCGTCVVIAGDTFEMNDDYKSVVSKDFSDDEATIKEAESSCPVDAISTKK